MIVKLILGLNMNTPVIMNKDGRTVSGAFMPPGIYPNWPESMQVPKSAKILLAMPDPGILKERGTQVVDLLAAQTSIIADKLAPPVVADPRPAMTQTQLTKERAADAATVKANRVAEEKRA